MTRRVVITGLGSISAQGIGADKLWEAIKEGKSGISKIERMDTSDVPVKNGAETKNFEPLDFMDRKEMKRMDRYSQFALAASVLAMNDSEINMDKIDKERLGVVIGTGVGGVETMEEQYRVLMEHGTKKVSPLLVSKMIANMAAAIVAIRFGAKGYNECIITACASSTNAIGQSFKIIERNDADIIITGGTEASFTKLAFTGFCANKAMSTNENPEEACRPFDLERDGFIMGDGSAILVLEELEHALKRDANIIAEVAGYGCTNDAFHITAPAPDGEGGSRCMKLAIKDAGISPSDIGYINAHGTSTPLNDKNETTAIKNVFGEYAYKLPVSSTKSMTGHLLGASGESKHLLLHLQLKTAFYLQL
jgi:3-oxoacyl-[acyl-carrier-protein] synthase II